MSHHRTESLVMRINAPGEPLLDERVSVTEPPAGWVRIDVQASGVCRADVGTAAASGRNVTFPVTPGHEVAGVIEELGVGVTGWSVGIGSPSAGLAEAAELARTAARATSSIAPPV